VLLSSKYDEGLANVNKKLEDLATALQGLLESNKAHESAHRPAADPPHQLPNGVVASPSPETEGDVPYEGESSFGAHSRHITETLGFALSSPENASSSSSPSVDSNLIQKLLQDVAAVQTPPREAQTQHQFTQYPELAGLSLPPMSIVLKLLKLAKTGLNRWLIEFQVMRYDDFTALCQKIYFPMEEYSIYNWIIVNGGLFNLYRDINNDLPEKLGISRDEMNQQVELCRRNIETAVHSIKLCIEPSLEACQALSIAAALAMEYAKVSTAWRLTATASRMCLDLGLHRLPKGEDAESRRKRMLFWYVYSMDKGLSFNFGRTPTIHDYDITVDLPNLSGAVEEAWAPLWHGMLEFAILQGDIYEQLFSVSALRQPLDVRIERAQAFARKLNNLRAPMLEVVESKDVPWLEHAKFSVLTSEMFIDCLLAIVYRVVPAKEPAHPLRFCDEAVESSRSALANLFKAWNLVKEEPPENWALFINWTLLFVPFVPIIVVFGNAIAQRNQSDLDMLRNVVSVLDVAAQKSPAALKLFNACSKFTKVAEALLSQDMPTIKNPDLSPSLAPVDRLPIDYQTLPDFPMSQSDWDGMLNDFDLGLGVDNAREMTSYFEPFLNNANQFN
jgi:hypothetical protein